MCVCIDIYMSVYMHACMFFVCMYVRYMKKADNYNMRTTISPIMVVKIQNINKYIYIYI